MKKWNRGVKHVSCMLALTLSLSMIWPGTTGAESAQVTQIQANTFVGDPGEMVESFDITVADVEKYKNLKASDFDITGNYDGYPLNAAGEIVQDNYEDDGITLSIKDDTIHMAVKPFKYPGGLKSEFAVTSKTYPELSFDQKSVNQVKTRTVDEFEKAQFTASNGVTLSYNLKRSPSKEAKPLMVWLHGGGEVGTDGRNHLTANRGTVVWTESGYDTSVLAVQYPENYKFKIYNNAEQLPIMQAYFEAQVELIQKLVAEGEVDPDRIYLSGVSSGGGGAFRFLMQYPDLFAGAIIVAAKDTVADYTGSVDAFKKELKGIVDVPMWIMHAQNDPTTDSRTSSLAYQALTEMGAKQVHLTLYDDAYMDSQRFYGGLKHWSWVPAFNNKEVIASLFKFHKGTNEEQGTGSSEHGVQPSEAVTRAQIAVILADALQLSEGTEDYPYVDRAPVWAAQAVAKVTKAGLMKGIGNQQFAPEREVTRAQMAVIVDHILANQDWKPAADSVERVFGDVNSKHWAYEAIQNSARAGVMTGVSKGKFDMKQTVTGAQLEQIMQRLEQVGTK
ncbi:poly(3-hydroxybutyrate) depolymerase [Paenibacillus sp. JGP012]|uniref:S-layer homology domain-containing protein n=1 Tax=Paenibacillus sp. JGP012 TaxID=2735914 RepID=UPI001620695A|nr:S-layer homology domain-containing protein [Paenibacillus sp. JGP012]MBB6020290.1 poly(3-hydroxybutyrate) depolymerase [Paenibacillus sp. JGP012]